MATRARRHGSAFLTGSGIVGISGNPKYIYAMHIIIGASASDAALRNGASASSTIYLDEKGIANQGITYNYHQGFFFPAGCYVSFNGSVTSVFISYDEN